jgi:hypothetical protein
LFFEHEKPCCLAGTEPADWQNFVLPVPFKKELMIMATTKDRHGSRLTSIGLIIEFPYNHRMSFFTPIPVFFGMHLRRISYNPPSHERMAL